MPRRTPGTVVRIRPWRGDRAQGTCVGSTSERREAWVQPCESGGRKLAISWVERVGPPDLQGWRLAGRTGREKKAPGLVTERALPKTVAFHVVTNLLFCSSKQPTRWASALQT